MSIYMSNILKFITKSLAFFNYKKSSNKKNNITHKKQGKAKRIEKAGIGEYSTIKELISDLDNVFNNLKKLKPSKSYTQKLVKRFGPHVSSLVEGDETDLIGAKYLEAFGSYGLPSFLISYWNKNNHNKTIKKDSDKFVQDFVIATKVGRPLSGQKKLNHSYYDVTHIFLREEDKHPYEINYCIEIDSTGKVNALKYKQCNVIDIRHASKKRSNKRPEYKNPRSKSSIPRSYSINEWTYPDLRLNLDDDHSEEHKKQLLETKFTLHFNLVMRREAGINIIVKKDGHRATFNVPHNDWKYFFKDRMKVKTINGSTKPIYHAVMSHTRNTKTGVSSVKTHYRGTRHFMFNGYEIKIVLQGKEGRSMADLNATMIDSEDKKSLKNGIDITKNRTSKTILNTFG